MPNTLLWSLATTVDYTYVTEDISRLIEDLIRTKPDLVAKFPNEMQQQLNEIQSKGLSRDATNFFDENDPNVPQLLAELRAFLSKSTLARPQQPRIGGNAAISAIRGYLLCQGPQMTELPMVRYAGLYPKSVQEVIERGEIENADDTQEVFRLAHPVDARPETVAIETAAAKLMLIYAPGRSPEWLLDKDGSFNTYIKELEGAIGQLSQGCRSMFCLHAPTWREVQTNTGQIAEIKLASRLVKSFEDHKPLRERMRVFVSTRGFPPDRKQAGGYALQVLELLKMADVVSMNEGELEALHTATKGGTHSKTPLAYKLRELPLRAIKVCHSAYGVIMDLGCRPEHIITSPRFSKDPAGFLGNVLRLSTDGATYATDASAALAQSANEAQIEIYSHYVAPASRQQDRFNATFLDITEMMPAGMLSSASAKVVRPLGAVVGLGAIFDGLLMSFLMRHST